MAVHSQQLGSVHAADAAVHTLYTVPVGVRTIVKSIVARNVQAGAQAMTVILTITGGATRRFDIWLTAVNTAGASAIVSPWIVLEAGETLGVQFSLAAGGDCFVSGTELLL